MNEMNEMNENEPTHRIGRVISDVGEMLSLPSSIEWPPFFFHYIIACICVLYIICVCVLNSNTLSGTVNRSRSNLHYGDSYAVMVP